MCMIDRQFSVCSRYPSSQSVEGTHHLLWHNCLCLDKQPALFQGNYVFQTCCSKIQVQIFSCIASEVFKLHLNNVYRITRVGRDLCRSCNPIPLSGPLKQVSQECIQVGLECLQRGRFNDHPGQLASVHCHPQRKETLAHVEVECEVILCPSVQYSLLTVSCYSPLCHNWPSACARFVPFLQ